jgi:hypothetical protein
MLHGSTFQYLKPSDNQRETMQRARDSIDTCARELDEILPEGPDKTYLIRKLREVGIWANVTITRLSDGTPREGATVDYG